MQLFSVTSTALGFLHRTETANSALETGWGESAAVLGKELPEAQEGNGRNLPSFHPPFHPKSRSKNAKIPQGCAEVWLHSPREMLCLPSALSVPGSASCSQECTQNIAGTESISAPGCRTPQQIPDSPLMAFISPVSVMAIKKYKLCRKKTHL